MAFLHVSSGDNNSDDIKLTVQDLMGVLMSFLDVASLNLVTDLHTPSMTNYLPPTHATESAETEIR